MRLGWMVVIGVAASSCLGVADDLRDDASVADAGARDAGAHEGSDAGALDGGETDAGVNDSGVGDAGENDSGVTDAGMADAGARDAGSVDAGGVDAGRADSGVADAGFGADAGRIDAGVRDAGDPIDAGLPPRSDAGVPAWVANLQAFTWYQIPNTHFAAIAEANVYDYSGATLQASGSVIHVFGGGHAGSDDNGVYALRLSDAVPAWSVACPRSPTDTPPGPYNSDGKPRARHTYGSARFSDVLNKMMVFGYAFDLNSHTFSVTDAFDPVTHTWAPAGTYDDTLGAGGPGTQVVQTNSGDMYFWTANWGVQKWSPNNPTAISGTTAAQPGLTYNSGALGYDSLRNVIVSFASSGSRRYDASNVAVSTPITFTNNGSGVVGDGFWVYVRELDAYVGIMNASAGLDTTVYKVPANVTGTTYAVSTLPIAGTPPTLSPGLQDLGGKGLFYGRWGYAPELKLVFLTHDPNTNVWVFKVG